MRLCNAWRGICKYSFPLSSRRKGYTCHLKSIEDRIVDDFDYDEDVHLEDCPLISAEEHDKEIRELVIDEFCEKLSSRLTEISDNATICGVKNVDFLTLDTVIDEILDIAEQMKEVRE